jgi:DNA replication protein DnaC
MTDDEETQPQVAEPTHPELLRDTLKRELAKLGLKPTEFTGHRCTGDCNRMVKRRGDYCDDCAQKQRHEFRYNLLRTARLTLPDWSWCRFGDPKFQKCTKKIQDAVAAADEWRPKLGSLVLLGPTGVGKTITGVAFAHKILERALSLDVPPEFVRLAKGLRFMVGRDLANARRLHHLGEGEAPAILEAQEATLLVLDEIGYEATRGMDGTPDTAIFDVLDARYRAARPVVVTSGLTKAKFSARYGAALMRRLEEVGQIIDLHARPR